MQAIQKRLTGRMLAGVTAHLGYGPDEAKPPERDGPQTPNLWPNFESRREVHRDTWSVPIRNAE